MSFDPKTLKPMGLLVFKATGSRVICDPPVLDTDEDFVVLVERMDDFTACLKEDGWEVNTNDHDYDWESGGEVEFCTARKGEVNLIIYEKVLGFDAFCRATDVAKHLNLTNKDDRVMLFQAVCANRKQQYAE